MTTTTADLLPYEQEVLSEIFEGRSQRNMSDLRNEFYQAIPGIKKKLYKHTVEQGSFSASPSSMRKRYRIHPDRVRRIRKDDAALLELGFEWVKLFVFNIPSQMIRPR